MLNVCFLLEYCQLSKDDVLRELKFLPLDGILGVSPDDNSTVQYGLTGLGDVLENGTTVEGHCYVWYVFVFVMVFSCPLLYLFD